MAVAGARAGAGAGGAETDDAVQMGEEMGMAGAGIGIRWADMG